jgi:hypothetical protein
MTGFKEILKYYFSKGDVSSRAKNCIEHYNLKNSREISEFINNQKINRNLAGVGNKTIQDLQNFLNYLIIEENKNLEKINDIIDVSNDTIQLYLYNNEFYNDSLLNEKKTFNSYVEKYFSSEKVTNRSRRLIESLYIETIGQLKNIVDNEELILKMGGFGVKTINDLNGLYSFIINNEKHIEKIVINDKDLVFELWFKVYEKLNDDIRAQINDYLQVHFKTSVDTQFDILYDELNKGIISLLEISSDVLCLFFIRILYIYYKNRNTLYKIYQYSILLKHPVFLFNCNVEYNRLSVRTKNVLKSTYFIESDEWEIDYFIFFKDYYNDAPQFIRPSYYGKTGQQIDEFLITLENTLSDIVNADEKTKIGEVRILLIDIIGNHEIDSDTLIDFSLKQLDVFNFFTSYFNAIFYELSKTAQIVFKNLFELPLLIEERNKITNLTNERIRQIRVAYQEYLFKDSKNKLNGIFEFSKFDYKLSNSFNDVHWYIDTRIRQNENDKLNYLFYSYLFGIANPDYYFVDMDIDNNEKSFFKIVKPLLIHKNFIEQDIFELLTSAIIQLNNKKYQHEIKLTDIIDSEDVYFDEIEMFVNFLIEKNELNHKIFCEDERIYNNLQPSLENIIENAMLYYNSMSTVEMIQSYIKDKHPDIKINENKIRFVILHNKNKFFHLGKTGKYGLLNFNYDDNFNKGFKSIRLLVKDCLLKYKRPMHLNDIIKDIMSNYNTLNSYSVERIIVSTKDFKTIGQSFFVLESSTTQYKSPINHKKIDSINLKFLNKYNVEFEWKKKTILEDYLLENDVPDYQILYIVKNHYFNYNNKIIKKFEHYITNDIKEILEDEAIKNILKNKYINSQLSLRIQIRKNIRRYIQSEYHISILEDDIQKLINFHIG